MKTQGEIESEISESITWFNHEYMGRGPKSIKTMLWGDVVVVRLQGVLSIAEQQLMKSLPVEISRCLLKDTRTQIIESARIVLEGLLQKVIDDDVKIISLHQDISTLTGEEFIIFTLSKVPELRQKK